jgi:hypothetical protein
MKSIKNLQETLATLDNIWTGKSIVILFATSIGYSIFVLLS